MDTRQASPTPKQKPFKRLVRWANFHLREDGRTIGRFAKTLPPEQRKQVLEQGKALTAARSLRNLPVNTRNVAASLIIGQGMWYVFCPMISEIPGIRDSSLGWLAWGGSDKLFITPDQLLYHTGGYSTSFAAQVADRIPRTVLIGSALVVAEAAADMSRSFTEYWMQKRYGVIPDALARAYGQVRPFPMRFSSIEAWQKLLGYALKPFTIGTPAQIFSSMQGILGSLWRSGPQLALALTIGRAIDKVLRKISECTGLGKIADRITSKASEKEGEALEAIRKAVGDRFPALQLMLAAESRSFWKWNPFRPAVSVPDAEAFAKVVSTHRNLEDALHDEAAISRLRQGIGECACTLESLFGRKRLLRMAPSFAEFCETAESIERPDLQALRAWHESFRKILEEMMAERS